MRPLACTALALLCLAGGAARAQDNFLGAFMGRGRKTKLTTSLSWERCAPARLEDGEGHVAFAWTSVRVGLTPWRQPPEEGPGRKEEAGRLSISGRVDRFDLDEPLAVGDAVLSSTLWRMSFGLSYQYTWESGWIAGANLSAGSSGSDPFGSDDVIGVNTALYLRVPSGDDGKSSWLFFLYYGSTGGELNMIPIPTAAYLWVPSDRFQLGVGIPFLMVNVRPLKWIFFNLTYLPVTNLQCRVGGFAGLGMLQAGFAWRNRSWLLGGGEDQVLYYEMRLFLTYTVFLGRKLTLVLEAAHAFNRSFEKGTVLARDEADRVGIEEATSCSAQVRFRF